MNAHGSLWRKLPAEERDRFEELAARDRDAKAKVADRALQSLYEQLEQAKHEGVDHKDPDIMPYRLAGCRLSGDDRADFDSFCSGPERSASFVAGLRDSQPGGSVGEDVHKVLDAMVVDKEPPMWHPWWMAAVARHRALLRGSIFKVVKLGEVKYVAFVYASQNPIFGCFVEVERLETTAPALVMASWQAGAKVEHTSQFAIRDLSLAFSDEPAFWECEYILVMTEVTAMAGGILASTSEFERLEKMVSMLDPFASRSASVASADEAAMPVPEKSWVDDPRLVNFWEHPSHEDDCFVKASASCGGRHGRLRP